MIGHLNNSLLDDLCYIFQHTASLWEPLKKQHIFMTGGTGFFGCWLLESFIYANEILKLNAKVTVLTRNYGAFLKKCPHLAKHPSIHFYEGNVTQFKFPTEQFSHMIHAASDTHDHGQDDFLETIIKGTLRVLTFAKYAGTKQLLFISSGAIYGSQPTHISHLSEEDETPYHPISDYGQAKQAAEQLCHQFGKTHAIAIKIARCFAFVGPYLPLDKHFAIGNFIHDAINEKPILIKGDGSTLRSYLYAADLAIWLWTILFKGQALYPYNVGSDEAITLTDLAHLIANHCNQPLPVTTMKTRDPLKPIERYIPKIARAKALGLKQGKTLQDAILLTKKWYHLSN